jgi:hypothetical protein
LKPRRLPRLGRRRRVPRAPLSLDLRPGLFLGRFGPEELRRELERAGILAGLAARGYGEVALVISWEAGEHRLLIRARGGRASLVDLRLQETTAVVEEEALRRSGLEVLSVLSNTWLSLQDPRARFTEARPRLPGQRWPGLGLARAFYLLMARWAHEWGKDAVLATPEYFHNAVFYSPAFRFLSPEEQGRFEALRRDLRGLRLAAASAAVDEGRVRDLVTGKVLHWRPGPMASPLSEGLTRALLGSDYDQAAGAACGRARFAVG